MKKKSWTRSAAEELYAVKGWSDGYFGVGEDGFATVHPLGEEGPRVSMMDVVGGLRARGLEMPVLLRFVDILASRIRRINESFARAIKDAGYPGVYRGVYPIKVNQQQHVVEEILKFGRAYHHGLETGSKAELIAGMAYMEDPEALLVCNGYKDEEFIDLALCAQKMGFRPMLVLEMPDELGLVLDRAERMGVRPLLGVRAKLAARAGGHWNGSGGDTSVFGLSAAQVIDMVDQLKARGMQDCLRMLHFHLGSQIPDIHSIRAAVAEGARFYCNLVQEGAAMGYFDVGGGLAVDYDGSHQDAPSSSNYSLDEYAADIVEVLMRVLDEVGVAAPTIVTESGRATVAHHSVLLFNVLDATRLKTAEPPEDVGDDSHELLRDLRGLCGKVEPEKLQENYHDAVHYRDEMRRLFLNGDVSLRERAQAERLFWHVVACIATACEGLKRVPEELRMIEASLADVYHANFSVFQSLPDSWAIDQLFPVMPIHRLDEEPTRQATLADITCDCDGRIDRFIDIEEERRTLAVHALNGQDYVMGVFLVGAYQETLGDLHNLLGDTHVVAVRVNEDGAITYEREIEGDTVADVLSYVEYSPKRMLERLRVTAERAVHEGCITAQERRVIMDLFQDGLRGYTYYEN